MEGVLVGISNGIYSLQDPDFTDETVVKEDIPKLEDKQGTFFPSVLYIFALPAFCRFNEISGSCTILAGLKVILDGNGRWAKKRGLPRTAGHKVGAETFRTIATYCRDIGIEYLTVYALA